VEATRESDFVGEALLEGVSFWRLDVYQVGHIPGVRLLGLFWLEVRSLSGLLFQVLGVKFICEASPLLSSIAPSVFFSCFLPLMIYTSSTALRGQGCRRRRYRCQRRQRGDGDLMATGVPHNNWEVARESSPTHPFPNLTSYK
jgi:hypothetical protein